MCQPLRRETPNAGAYLASHELRLTLEFRAKMAKMVMMAQVYPSRASYHTKFPLHCVPA